MTIEPPHTQFLDHHGRTWQVRLIAGNQPLSIWPLTDTPLIVGRALGCHIRLQDPSVSRIQCELYAASGMPHIRERSGTNPTLLNGNEFTDERLKVGDIIEVGQSQLTIDCFDRDSQPVVPRFFVAPTTKAFDDCVFLNSAVKPDPAYTDDAISSDALALFTLLRMLAKATTLEKLSTTCCSHLLDRFGPANFWFALCQDGSEDFILYPPSCDGELSLFPNDTAILAVTSGEGIVVADGLEGTSTLCVPLVHGNTPYGVIALTRVLERGPYGEQHLQYLLAAAEVIAPLVLALQRVEQLQRDVLCRSSADATGKTDIGASAHMKEVRRRLCDAAAARGNVLILGETGVGKELAARMLHDLSSRSNGPYVVVNCAAIQETLFESELFGHEKGSFTGAYNLRRGLFEQAHGGTLFLDEVGELSIANQSRLLRAIESGLIRRVGGEADIQVDVRIVSATNRPLPDSGRENFRIDLYYRLSSFSIWIPPLRERTEDIPAFAKYFLAEFSPNSPARPSAFSEQALLELMTYSWPGNVRELRNVVERACYSTKSRTIDIEDIHLLPNARIAKDRSFRKSLDELEHDHLLQALRDNCNNVAKAAESLGIAASTMYYKLRKHNISLKSIGAL